MNIRPAQITIFVFAIVASLPQIAFAQNPLENVDFEITSTTSMAASAQSSLQLEVVSPRSVYVTFEEDRPGEDGQSREVAVVQQTVFTEEGARSGSYGYANRDADIEIAAFSRLGSSLISILAADFGGHTEFSYSFLEFPGGVASTRNGPVTAQRVSISSNDNDDYYDAYYPRAAVSGEEQIYIGFDVGDALVYGERWPEVWSLSRSGDVAWKVRGGLRANDQFLGLASGAARGVYMLAEVRSGVDDQSRNLWLAKYDANGQLQWDWYRERGSVQNRLLYLKEGFNSRILLAYVEHTSGGESYTILTTIDNQGRTSEDFILPASFEQAQIVDERGTIAFARRIDGGDVHLVFFSPSENRVLGDHTINALPGERTVRFDIASSARSDLYVGRIAVDGTGRAVARIDLGTLSPSSLPYSGQRFSMEQYGSALSIDLATSDRQRSERQERIRANSSQRSAEVRQMEDRLAANRELERQREADLARKTEASISGLWSDTIGDIRRSVDQSVRATREPERVRRTPQRSETAESRTNENAQGASVELADRSGSSTGSPIPQSAQNAPVQRYWVWSYYCDFYGWPSAQAQSEGPGASRPGFAAIRPMVVSRDRGHDWMAELDRLERKSRREIEHRVVQSSIRLATDLEDFSCGGGLSNPYDTQLLANDMADNEKASQDANAQSAEGGSVLVRFNPFN